MANTFHHHPDGWITIISGAQEYTDTPENFAQDYQHPYPGLPPGIKEFRYVEGGIICYITDDDVQIGSDMDLSYVQNAIKSIASLLSNQAKRLQAQRSQQEADPAIAKRMASEDAIKQIAANLGIDTGSFTWRDDLFVALVQKVFGEAK